MTKEITLNHICKIEGHANLTLKIDKNKVTKCELQASEGARFFEGLVIGKNLKDIQEIVSRICGICSCAHSVCAVQALEEAMGVEPTAQQKFIRQMLTMGERIRSHATHLYFLSLPDYFGAASALSLGKEHRSKINDALEIISIGNKIVEVFGGRDLHPFLEIKEHMPEKDFSMLLEKLEKVKPTLLRTIELFTGLNYPEMNRETDYLSLKKKDEYAANTGKVYSHTGAFIDDYYKKHLAENIKEYATSKFVLKEGKPYMLGAMARINNNSEQLGVESKKELDKTLKKLKIKLPFVNPYHNIVCQAIEILEAVNTSIDLIKNVPNKKEVKEIKIKEGHGVSASEAPRGTLFHEYRVDNTGKITYCNIITPTAQNLNMMEEDIVRLVEALLVSGNSKSEIVEKVEKLIRAYDPCFSCSTHFLKVNWE